MYSSHNSLYTSFLYHSGVKGMKWGIRRKAAKETRHLKTKNGLDVDLVRKDPSIIARALGKMSPKIKKQQQSYYGYNIKVGKKIIGDLQLDKTSAKELNVVWVTVNKKYKGQKIAQAVMNDVLKKGSELGVSKVTLEVPGISPDARHIYEKIGFKKNKRISNEDDVWGGLTSMTYKYNNGGKH